MNKINPLNPPGRRALPEDQRRSKTAHAVLTEKEFEQLTKAANAAGVSVSNYCRAAVLRALTRSYAKEV